MSDSDCRSSAPARAAALQGARSPREPVWGGLPFLQIASAGKGSPPDPAPLSPLSTVDPRTGLHWIPTGWEAIPVARELALGELEPPTIQVSIES